MSNARELALLEKWSSDGAKILPSLSSPTSPKATKFCCCPNRRRYNIKQPKLTTTLHVRNIFVDNDFNFIDDPTLNDGDNNEDGDSQEQQLTIESIKNYKRAESWPSAKNTQKYYVKNSKLLEAKVYKENLQQNVAAKENDYDDVEEIVNNNSSKVITKEFKAKVNEPVVLKSLVQVAEGEEQWRHHKSCHNNNRNNCLTNEHERKSNNSRCLTEFTNKKQQHQKQQLEEVVKKLVVKKNLKQSGNEEASNPTNSKTQQTKTTADIDVEKQCENFKKLETLTAINRQVLANTRASPFIQRLSEISELKSSLSNITPSNKTKTSQQQQSKKLQQCNNCLFCFNQNCQNFTQLKQSLQYNSTSNNQESWYDSNSCCLENNNKMTITSPSTTNLENNRKCSIVINSNNISSECDTLTLPQEQLAVSANNKNSTKMPTTPTSPKPRSNSNTPSSPLTTTVIKTTMVKRSPANESTAMTTTTTSPVITPATTPTSASLSLEKCLPATNNFQDVAKENKPAINKSLTVPTAACVAPVVATATAATNATSAPLSVKERIAALVAGNEQIHKHHDNFIKNKNQCNKPMKLTTQNMTCQQPENKL